MRRVVAALLFAACCAAAVFATTETPEEIARRQYQEYRQAQILEVSLRSEQELRGSDNIFYLGADDQEWTELEPILEGYFAALQAQGFQEERLSALAGVLDGYRITLKSPCFPIGYYSIREQRVYLDEKLFAEEANGVFTTSVVYHEKVHQNQLRRLDRELLRFDQRQRYREKLLEIGAHYQQIRYVLAIGDPQAVRLTLENSRRQRIFPNILECYPAGDPVVEAVRRFMEPSSDA